MGRDSLFQRSFQKRRRTHSTGRVCSREGEERREWGKERRRSDASMKSHVPSRVHRNVAGRLAVSGHARACWWSPVFSSAQVDATRAPHGRRARGTAERRGGGREEVDERVSVEQQWWRQRAGEGARGEARSTVGGTKSRKIQVAP